MLNGALYGKSIAYVHGAQGTVIEWKVNLLARLPLLSVGSYIQSRQKPSEQTLLFINVYPSVSNHFDMAHPAFIANIIFQITDGFIAKTSSLRVGVCVKRWVNFTLARTLHADLII